VNRIVPTLALTALLTLMLAGPAFAGMIACPPSPPPGSTLECGVSNSEPEETLTWEASFADGTDESGELTTDEEGSGGLAVAIPDDPELAGTQFTITLETGASYTGMVGSPEDESAAAAAAEDGAADGESADADVEAQGTAAGEEATDDGPEEQVTERPAEDSEVALGAGGTAGTPGLALLAAALGGMLVLGGGTFLVRAAARR
jgi:hypothetical protein